jgi:hypothetical protein
MALLGAMALVAGIRLSPLWLAGADAQAERLAQDRIQQFVELEVNQKIPAAQRHAMGAFDARQWIEQNPGAYASLLAEESRALKDQWRYRGENGRHYAYLGDLDSYLWLRQARTYLRTGTVCDATLNGACRDTYTNAPVGSHMVYERSLHVAAIVGLHRFVTVFDPDYPLPASAFLVPVIVGVLGVLPAFFIGWRLAGIVGGFFAALLVGLQPEFLLRSIGSDNDVWNAVLPLYAAWAAMGALGARESWRQITCAALAGGVIGLQVLAWGGWLFSYAVLMGGLLAFLLLQGLRTATLEWPRDAGQGRKVRKAALVAAVFYATAGISTTLAGAEQAYLAIPGKIMSEVTGWTAGSIPAESAMEAPPASGASANTPGLAESTLWPDVLTTVSELLEPDTGALITNLGGEWVFLAGLLGLLLSLLPRNHWNWRHLAVIFCGISCYGYLVSGHEIGRFTAQWLIAGPLFGALIVHLLTHQDRSDAEVGGALILAAWFLAALHMAYAGNRFLLLIGPPFGIACGVAAGRLSAWGRRFALDNFIRSPAMANLLTGVLLAVLLLQPVQRGFASASGYLPQMNDAWWDTLTRIRDASPADAIVNAWWDYGHWVKYVAERRVSSDGSSQRTHVPHWFAKALMAPQAQKSVGLLRMLNCGSDATPRPEGDQGAYGKLRALGYDPVGAYATLEYVTMIDRDTARAYLKSQGVEEPSKRRGILDATHCDPPDSYLVLSSRLFDLPALMHLGLWDPRRAYIANSAQFQDSESAVADLRNRFGYSEQQAARLLARARARARKQADAGEGSFESQLNSFIGSSRGLLTAEWLPCHAGGDSQQGLTCPLGIRAELAGIVPGAVLKRFIYEPDAPLRSRFELEHIERDTVAEVAPGAIILAGVDQKLEIETASPRLANVGVLVDLANRRVLLGPPHLVRSTITDLVFLDGRYTAQFEKFDERITPTGERVMTWKINWDDS